MNVKIVHWIQILNLLFSIKSSFYKLKPWIKNLFLSTNKVYYLFPMILSLIPKWGAYSRNHKLNSCAWYLKPNNAQYFTGLISPTKARLRVTLRKLLYSHSEWWIAIRNSMHLSLPLYPLSSSHSGNWIARFIPIPSGTFLVWGRKMFSVAWKVYISVYES